jgi:hypothetical protein
MYWSSAGTNKRRRPVEKGLKLRIVVTGFEDPLTAREVFEDPLTARKDFEDPLTAREEFEDPLTARQSFEDPLTALQGFEDPLTARFVLEGFEEPLFLEKLKGFEEPLFLEVRIEGFDRILQVRVSPKPIEAGPGKKVR